jgi:urea carboxylase-associated protein 2
MQVSNGTSSLAGARDHARSLAGDSPRGGRTVPATAAVELPDGVAPGAVVWDELVPLGGYAGQVLARGDRLRLTDVDGDACVQLLVHAAGRPAERLNVADTVKVQWQAYLGPGALLLSDMGRVLLSIAEDTSDRHDALCGATSRRLNDERHGDGSASGPAPSGRDLLVLAATKQGLERRDVASPVNLFKSVRVGPDGSLALEGEPRPGRHVELRAELDVVVLLAVTPHPLDDRPSYSGNAVRCTAWRADHPGSDDLGQATPERRRAFENTAELLRSAR